jgi:hypothetical protein
LSRPFGPFGSRPHARLTPPGSTLAARWACPVGATSWPRAPLLSLSCRTRLLGASLAHIATYGRVPPVSSSPLSSPPPRPVPVMPTSTRIVATVGSRGITPPPPRRSSPTPTCLIPPHSPTNSSPLHPSCLTEVHRGAPSSAQLLSLRITSAVACTLAALGAPPPFRRAARSNISLRYNQQEHHIWHASVCNTSSTPGPTILTPGNDTFVRTLSSLMRTQENFPVGHPS